VDHILVMTLCKASLIGFSAPFKGSAVMPSAPAARPFFNRDLETGDRGRSRSFKMEPIDRSYDFLLVGHCKYSCILYHFRALSRN